MDTSLNNLQIFHQHLATAYQHVGSEIRKHEQNSFLNCMQLVSTLRVDGNAELNEDVAYCVMLFSKAYVLSKETRKPLMDHTGEDFPSSPQQMSSSQLATYHLELSTAYQRGIEESTVAHNQVTTTCIEILRNEIVEPFSCAHPAKRLSRRTKARNAMVAAGVTVLEDWLYQRPYSPKPTDELPFDDEPPF